MIAVASLPLWRARGPRFLLLMILGWIGIRLMATISPPLAESGVHSPNAHEPIWSAGPEAAMHVNEAAKPRPLAQNNGPTESPWPASPTLKTKAWANLAMPEERIAPTRLVLSAWDQPQRHQLRLAALAGLMPRVGRPAAATQSPVVGLFQFPAGQTVPPPPPVWPAARPDRWSLAAYSFWRCCNDGPRPLAGNQAPVLGGSQSGLRLDYRLRKDGPERAFARLTLTPAAQIGADVAVGLTTRPHRALPLEVHLEQRLALAGSGQNRTLLYASAGIDDRPVAADLRLSAYAQAGVAGPHRIEGFADGAISLERAVIERRMLRLSIGAMAAGAAQRGAARVDIGPRATLDLPKLGQGAALALDWRERVAGNAHPGGGVALTLSAGF